jgi:hypothetical protein
MLETALIMQLLAMITLCQHEKLLAARNNLEHEYRDTDD